MLARHVLKRRTQSSYVGPRSADHPTAPETNLDNPFSVTSKCSRILSGLCVTVTRDVYSLVDVYLLSEKTTDILRWDRIESNEENSIYTSIIFGIIGNLSVFPEYNFSTGRYKAKFRNVDFDHCSFCHHP